MKRSCFLLLLALSAFLSPTQSNAFAREDALQISPASFQLNPPEPELRLDTQGITPIRHAVRDISGGILMPAPVVARIKTVPSSLQMAPRCVHIKSYLWHNYPAMHFW